MVRVWPCARGEAGDDAARAARRGDTCARGDAAALSQHVPARIDDFSRRVPPRMANFTCAEWAARAKSTTFARTAGGIICTTSPARDGLTPIGRTDSATTFDSPFSADLLAVWGLGIPLFARLWSGRALFDGICGSRSPPSPASIFLAGDFLYTKFCVQSMG